MVKYKYSKLFLYFQLSIMEELWFVDTPVWTETTISQFLDVIEGNENWTDVDKKTFKYKWIDLVQTAGTAQDNVNKTFQKMHERLSYNSAAKYWKQQRQHS